MIIVFTDWRTRSGRLDVSLNFMKVINGGEISILLTSNLSKLLSVFHCGVHHSQDQLKLESRNLKIRVQQ